jgi:transcriptional regulator with XRE-family HTH domain
MPADADAPDPTPPDWLRALIEGAGITQREAARRLHVEERSIRRWLAGDRAIPWSAAELLRRLLA